LKKRKINNKERRKKMKTYDVKITFKSHCNKEDLKDDKDLIYKFIRENFWNIDKYSYDFKITKKGEKR
tara:strand:+ start:1451 stop:1654 length:204 start_codon:yes stop_codon:yes gene_type:complete